MSHRQSMLHFLSNLCDCFKEQVGLGFCSDRDLSMCLVLIIWGTTAVFKGTWWTEAPNTWRSTSGFNITLLVVSLYWYTAKQYAWFLWDYREYFSVYFWITEIQAVSFKRNLWTQAQCWGWEETEGTDLHLRVQLGGSWGSEGLQIEPAQLYGTALLSVEQALKDKGTCR